MTSTASLKINHIEKKINPKIALSWEIVKQVTNLIKNENSLRKRAQKSHCEANKYV